MSDEDPFALFDGLSHDSKMALLLARKAVSEHGGVAVDLDHLVMGLLTVLETALQPLLGGGTTVPMVSGELVKNVSAAARPSEGQEIPTSAEVWSALQRAVRGADRGGRAVTPAMLLSVILEGPEPGARDTLMRAGITPAVVRQLPGD